jgi:uncharacterized HAD superfamily protein
MILFRRKHRKQKEHYNDISTVNQHTSNDTVTNYQADLRCEEAIIYDKQRFGRVRKHLMMQLRAQYGRQTADRAMWRVNKRAHSILHSAYHSNSLPDSVL